MKEGATLLGSNLDRASALIHSFKQVAADQTSDQSRRFEVKAWLADLLTSLGPVLRKSGHEVAVDCPEGLWIDTYPGALGQVLTNLIINSVTHGFAGVPAGRISIVAAEPAAGAFRVTFSDNGKGIPPENIGKIFDPFFTTGRSAGNTGLGLHIAYNLVTSKLRGRIEVDSTPGEGTRFTIEIPSDVRADEAEEAAAAE
jgi:signal transduction histidine kinase